MSDVRVSGSQENGLPLESHSLAFAEYISLVSVFLGTPNIVESVFQDGLTKNSLHFTALCFF